MNEKFVAEAAAYIVDRTDHVYREEIDGPYEPWVNFHIEEMWQEELAATVTVITPLNYYAGLVAFRAAVWAALSSMVEGG